MTRSLIPIWSSASDLPTVTIRATDSGQEIVLRGKSDEDVSLRATTYDLFRSLGGRRRVTQILDLDWDGSTTAVELVAPRLIVPFFAEPAESIETAA